MLDQEIEEQIKRGERLKHARKMLNITITEMTQDNQIKYNTVCSWESGKHAGLTEQGAKKAIRKFSSLGLNVTLPWLLFGIGSPPKFRDIISSQINILKKEFPSLMVHHVNDEGMLPTFKIGDAITGMPHALNSLYDLNQKPVIIQINSNLTHFRILNIDNNQKNIQLKPLNPGLPTVDISISDVKKAAKINMHLIYDNETEDYKESSL